MEQASKSSHQHVINDAEVQKFLGRCALPRSASDVALNDHVLLDYEPVAVNPIRHIVAVDSGFTEVPVQKNFPSSTLCFFQFGALMFRQRLGRIDQHWQVLGQTSSGQHRA